MHLAPAGVQVVPPGQHANARCPRPAGSGSTPVTAWSVEGPVCRWHRHTPRCIARRRSRTRSSMSTSTLPSSPRPVGKPARPDVETRHDGWPILLAQSVTEPVSAQGEATLVLMPLPTRTPDLRRSPRQRPRHRRAPLEHSDNPLCSSSDVPDIGTSRVLWVVGPPVAVVVDAVTAGTVRAPSQSIAYSIVTTEPEGSVGCCRRTPPPVVAGRTPSQSIALDLVCEHRECRRRQAAR